MSAQNLGLGSALPDAAAPPTQPLFSCETGEIACRRHAPFEGSNRWMCHGWREVPPEDRIRWEYIEGKPMECQTCAHAPEGDA